MKSYIYMIFAAIFLGTIGVLVKIIGNSVHFMTLNFLRVFFGLIFLLIVVPLIDKRAFSITRKDVKEFFLIGVIYAISLSLYTTANLFTSIQNAVLINYIYPFFVLIFAYIILKEKITYTKIITLILAIIGISFINPFNFNEGFMGNMMALSGAIFYGILITLMRKENKTHSIKDVLWFFIFASIILSPAPFMFGIGNLSGNLIYIIILGFVSTGLVYLLYNLALENMEAETASVTAMIITPLVSIFLAFMIINEQISVQTIVGGVILLLAGISLEIHSKKLKAFVNKNFQVSKKRK